jgi:hypothetical protein
MPVTAELWTGAFHRQSAKQGYHSRLHVDVSIFQRNGVDTFLEWYDRTRTVSVRVLLHNGGRDIAALSDRAAPQRSRIPAGRWGPTPSYFVAMVFLSSGVSGMTNMLQTSMTTNNLSPSSGQASFCWHCDEIYGVEHRQYEPPAPRTMLRRDPCRRSICAWHV